MSQQPTVAITLVFTDIEGPTYLLQQLGERYVSVLSECRDLLRRAAFPLLRKRVLHAV